MRPTRVTACGLMMAAVCGITLAASPALAREGHRKGKDPNEYTESLAKKLQLNDQQRAQVEQIITDYRGRAQALHEQFATLRQEKRDKIRAVLTPEQQAEFDKMPKGHKWGDKDDDDEDDDKPADAKQKDQQPG